MLDIFIIFDWIGDDEIIQTKNVQNHFFCTKKHKITPLTLVILQQMTAAAQTKEHEVVNYQ